MVYAIPVAAATRRGRHHPRPTDDRLCQDSRGRAMVSSNTAPDFGASAPPAPATTSTPRVAGTLAAACVAVLVAQIANALPASLNGLFQSDLGAVGSQLT